MSFLEAVAAKVIKIYKLTNPFSGDLELLWETESCTLKITKKGEAAEKRLAKKAEKLSAALESDNSDHLYFCRRG